MSHPVRPPRRVGDPRVPPKSHPGSGQAGLSGAPGVTGGSFGTRQPGGAALARSTLCGAGGGQGVSLGVQGGAHPPPDPPPVTPLSHLGSSQPVLAGEAAVARGALWRKRRWSELEWGGRFLGCSTSLGDRGGHTLSLRVAPRGRQHRVHRGLLSCLPRQRVRGHLGVPRVPVEEKGVTRRGGTFLCPSQPPITPRPRGCRTGPHVWRRRRGWGGRRGGGPARRIEAG